ncbi:MAG: nucleoside triphosphate pyrophosphohydrolase [Thermodesulfobacteriota bacterium]
MSETRIKELLKIMARLRGPSGCPWDRKQDLQSLIPFLIEESYEVIEAIEKGDRSNLQEELGDLLYQIIFLAEITGEKGWFDLGDIISHSIDKMIRRHPHVFGNEKARNAKEALDKWNAAKEKEKGKEIKGSPLDEVPTHLPALMRAQKITERASRIGFDWKGTGEIVKKIEEEIEEFKNALKDGDKLNIKEELGDVLFALVNIGRFLEIDTEDALRKATNKFATRFDYVVENISNDKGFDKASLEEMERLWNEAKEVFPLKEGSQKDNFTF